MKKVIIIGSGIGGLSTAIRLLKLGYEVTILEKENTIGGKVNVKNIENARFDLTASILMTPKAYTDIFKSVDKNYKKYFELVKINPMYRVFYNDGTKYDIYSEIERNVKLLENIQEGLSTEYMKFLSLSLKKYLYSKKYFLDKPMLNKEELLNLDTVKKLIEINPFSSTNDYLKNIISNEKIIKYLIFQSMYIGVNPYTNSNLYSLIPAISHSYGLWYVKGGFYKYIQALEQLILELGGKIEKDTCVEKIVTKDNKVLGVKANNKAYKSNIVISNADYPYTINKLIVKKKEINKLKLSKYSSSVFMIYLGLDKKYNELQLHNIYIGKDFDNNIQSPFKGILPKIPSLYLYYPSKIDESISGRFSSILNIMVRVPNLKYKDIKWDKYQIRRFRNDIMEQVENIKGLENIEEHILYESYLTPVQLKYKFNSYNGTAFGLGHELSQTTYFRPHMKDKDIDGLYFIGSSTHPGSGVSVIIEGSKVLTNIIDKDTKVYEALNNNKE